MQQKVFVDLMRWLEGNIGSITCLVGKVVLGKLAVLLLLLSNLPIMDNPLWWYRPILLIHNSLNDHFAQVVINVAQKKNYIVNSNFFIAFLRFFFL
jgi:hypothetical protein